MPNFLTFTGPGSKTALGFRIDTRDDRIVPAAEQKWLEQHPKQIARIRRLEVLLDAELNLTVPTFVFSLRIFDPREAEGWRIETIYLPGASPYTFDGEQSLEEVWPDAKDDPAKENDFVLNALNEAFYTGEYWAGVILRSLVLPDPSGLDPEDWGLEFTPYNHQP